MGEQGNNKKGVLKDEDSKGGGVIYRGFPERWYRRVGIERDLITRTLGAVSLLTLWTIWLGGSFSPIWMFSLFRHGYYKTFAVSGFILAYPWIVTVKQQPRFVRFILNACGWFEGGNTLIMEPALEGVDAEGQLLLCISPHGVYSYGFFLNGPASRILTGQPEKYSPPCFQNRHHRGVGLVEPLLFKIPLIRHFLYAMGNALPASKKVMTHLMKSKMPLGLLPGGSEEIIISKCGHDRVWIKERKGFIKYALMYGYTIAIGYTFGESDSYRCLPWFIPQRLWLWKRFKILLFFPWGCWFCPLLPRRDVCLETVLGNPIALPRIENPTQEDIDKWHQIYIDNLVDLFDRNKAKFGYGDRTLELW